MEAFRPKPADLVADGVETEMSYSAHRRDALDESLPVRHRLSHVRSCAVHLSQKYNVRRSVILSLIGIAPAYDEQGVPSYDADNLPSSQQIEEAVRALDRMKVSGIPPMYKLGHVANGEWVAHSHPPLFEMTERIVAGVPDGDPDVFDRLVECLEPPYYLLYVLHTPRGEGLPGRYQSPAISLAHVKLILARYSSYFAGDARFDLWALSPSGNATVVWDRHNLIFAYGPLERYSAKLISMGFRPGNPTIPAPHAHHYRPELDQVAKQILTELDWSYSPLRPEDRQ